MSVPKLEKLIGIEVYATRSLGVGGVIRKHVDDFRVEEVLVDGSKARTNVRENADSRGALGSSSVTNHYQLCVLIKRNWDTFSAVKTIADQLGVNTERIQIAGIKDAKAITAQYITIEGVTTEEVQNVKVKDIELRSLGYFRAELSSFYLLGNSFHITIGTIDHPKMTIEKRVTQTVEELNSTGGAPNFFGHQRFGTIRPITHLVGKAIVKGKIKKAAMLFLAKPSPHEHTSSRQARSNLQTTQDFKQALKEFPKQLRYERLMLKHLDKKPDDYVGAFKKLPKKLQRLFVQAYQAYLFNKSLSRRITNELPVNKAEVGDYVVSIDRSGLPMVSMDRMATAQTLVEVNKAIESGKMRLALPLMGFKQPTSEGKQGEIEEQILQEEDVHVKNFKVKVVPEMSTRGELRAAITPIGNFSLDEISQEINSSQKHEAKVRFMLYRGSYATIVLRELMKPNNPVRAGF